MTGRKVGINQNTVDYFEVADRKDLSYEEKLARYDQLANAYFQADEFVDFCAASLPELDAVVRDYFTSAEFDDLVVHAIRLEVEPERHEEMIERCRGLVADWAADQRG